MGICGPNGTLLGGCVAEGGEVGLQERKKRKGERERALKRQAERWRIDSGES